MIKVSELVLVFNNLMPTPDTAFKLMVAYCKKSGRNMWEEFGYTFSASAKTIIILRKDEKRLYPFGFCNLHYNNTNDEIFLNQGFLFKPVDNAPLLLSMIHDKMVDFWNLGSAKKMVIHSDLPERLWKRFGFKKSKFAIYERMEG